MTTELIEILFAWAVMLSPYDRAPVPVIEPVPHEFFVENVCDGRECSVIGWYNDTGIVYIDDRLKSLLRDEILVHELVHYLQDMSGKFDINSCEDSLVREREAFYVQGEYTLRVRGTWPAPMNMTMRCNKQENAE